MTREHWEAVFKTKTSHQVGWYQPHLQRSLSLIERSGVGTNSHIIDVGGGESTLAQDLLERGFRAVTVLDISATALARARGRLGERAGEVTWIEADVTKAKLTPAEYDLWHDRAVFHFLTTSEDKRKYVDLLTRCLRPPGYLVIATFGPDGPDHCSGLPTMRYGPEDLRTELGSSYTLLEAETEIHVTPGRVRQSFVYCLFRMGEPHTPPNNSLEPTRTAAENGDSNAH